METRPFARRASVVAVAVIVAGCSAAHGEGSSTTPTLQLRIVMTSEEGKCSAPPLTSDGSGSACGSAGTTTYELDESLAVVTPTSVSRGGSGTGQAVVVEFDKADTATINKVMSEALDKRLAILLDGKVLSAPTVKDAITTGTVSFGFATAAEAEQVEAALSGSATS